ncbi:hypothetical protein BgiBS90_018688 [Biomphalaria glabrata]|nr:hypothetical protein BgiBS90_018688 [Biomphalaria glabrata]
MRRGRRLCHPARLKTCHHVVDIVRPLSPRSVILNFLSTDIVRHVLFLLPLLCPQQTTLPPSAPEDVPPCCRHRSTSVSSVSDSQLLVHGHCSTRFVSSSFALSPADDSATQRLKTCRHVVDIVRPLSLRSVILNFLSTDIVRHVLFLLPLLCPQQTTLPPSAPEDVPPCCGHRSTSVSSVSDSQLLVHGPPRVDQQRVQCLECDDGSYCFQQEW